MRRSTQNTLLAVLSLGGLVIGVLTLRDGTSEPAPGRRSEAAHPPPPPRPPAPIFSRSSAALEVPADWMWEGQEVQPPVPASRSASWASVPDVPLHWYVDDAGHVVRIQVKPEEQQVIEDPAWVRHLLANPSDPISFYRFSDDIPVSVTGRWTSDPASPEFEHLRKFVVRSGGSVCYWPVRLRKGERQMRGVMRRIVDPADPDRAAPNAAVITYDFFAEDADSETGFEIIGMSGYYTFYRLGQDPRPEDTKAWLNLRLKESYEWTPPQESALSEWNRESYIRVINLELERHAEIFDKKWANMSRILQLTRDLGDQYEKRVAKIDDYLSETPRPEESSRRYKREIAIRLNREKFELAEMEKAVKDRANPK